MEQVLSHHGVKGMKWGVRKEEYKSLGSAKKKETRTAFKNDRKAAIEAYKKNEKGRHDALLSIEGKNIRSREAEQTAFREKYSGALARGGHKLDMITKYGVGNKAVNRISIEKNLSDRDFAELRARGQKHVKAVLDRMHKKGQSYENARDYVENVEYAKQFVIGLLT